MKITPSAKTTAVGGWDRDSEGAAYLKASVTAAPEKGKANKALISLLSAHYSIPKSALIIVQGETGRMKTIFVASGYENFIN